MELMVQMQLGVLQPAADIAVVHTVAADTEVVDIVVVEVHIVVVELELVVIFLYFE